MQMQLIQQWECLRWKLRRRLVWARIGVVRRRTWRSIPQATHPLLWYWFRVQFFIFCILCHRICFGSFFWHLRISCESFSCLLFRFVLPLEPAQNCHICDWLHHLCPERFTRLFLGKLHRDALLSYLYLATGLVPADRLPAMLGLSFFRYCVACFEAIHFNLWGRLVGVPYYCGEMGV